MAKICTSNFKCFVIWFQFTSTVNLHGNFSSCLVSVCPLTDRNRIKMAIQLPAQEDRLYTYVCIYVLIQVYYTCTAGSKLGWISVEVQKHSHISSVLAPRPWHVHIVPRSSCDV